jgi:hypothetical protein
MIESATADPRLPSLARALAALVLFSLSFGYAEAAVVVYLRALYEPIHQRINPNRSAGDLFPLVPPAELASAEPLAARWLEIERTREYATLLLLVAAALAVANNFHQWLAAFLVAFGLWDIFFYGFLKLLIDWPGSLAEWDLLFLLPVPWVGPVWAPLLVAATMVAAGVIVLRREAAGLPPLRLGWTQASAIMVGGLIIVVAFCWDYPNTTAGGAPDSFPWPLFAAGQTVGMLGLWHAWRRTPAVEGTPQFSSSSNS